MSANMIGVRFREASKIYHFAPPEELIHEGEYVVVETARGLEMARVVTVPAEDAGPVPRDARPIVRLADATDRDQAERMRDHSETILTRTRELSTARDLPMYVAAVQLNLAGKEATCHFQADGHVDFTPVITEVEQEFDVRVHMQQAGPRDRAKIVDGHDICGLRLCCSSWMTTFPKVGVRMAKEQSLALNPDKISGVCGRLLCCLTFEFEVYREMRGTLPKVGKRVSTPSGMGKVVQTNVLKQTIMLELDEHAGRVEVPAAEIGMAVRVEEQPNAALEETLSDVLGHDVSTKAAPSDAGDGGSGSGRRRRGRRGGRGDGRGTAPEQRASAPTEGPASGASDAEAEGRSAGRGRRRRRRSGGEGAAPEQRGPGQAGAGGVSPRREESQPAASGAASDRAADDRGVGDRGASADGDAAPRRRRRRR
ncbi:MAG: Cell fate regulator YaaT, partial [Chloroflexi bacterium]